MLSAVCRPKGSELIRPPSRPKGGRDFAREKTFVKKFAVWGREFHSGFSIVPITERRFSMASYMLVRAKVRDYLEWKRGYDAHLPKRVEGGLTEKYLLRGAKDQNEVILLFEARDLNRAKTFAESADLRETMQKVGVMDKPDIYFLNG
jgi:hypothetical protein